MRYVSLFSGIEAASVAWEPLGWEPVAFSEIEPFPCAVLKERFPQVPNLGDVSKIDWSSYVGAVDIVVGGSPCQSFSVAGKREGLAGASGLMFEYIRAVRDISPRYFVWENVPGALSSEGGAAFGQLLREMDDLGYGMAWRVLDAQFFGVAQRRRRVYLVGCLGNPERAAEILFERESLRWDHPSSRAKREELALAAGRSVGGDGGCMNPWDCQSNRVFGTGGVFQTLYAHEGSGRHNCSVLVFDESQITSPGNRSRPGFGCPCHTLTTDGRAPVAVAFSAGQSGKAGSVGAQAEVSPTLRAGSSGTNQVPTVCMASTQANAEAVWRWPWIVRRLMPVECERLQGFPDNWTAIPYRGKPAEECPDAPRYKAIGNSMAVPVMTWIGERIAMVEREVG